MTNTYSKKEEILKAIENAIEAQEALISEYKKLVAGDFIAKAVIDNIECVSVMAIKDLKGQAELLQMK